MFYLYIKRENICIYGCKWRRICPQPTGPCHSACLQSPTQPQSPDIPIPIRITHFFLGSCIAHLCAPRPHHCSDRSSASLLDRLTTATFSFYTCIVSVLSIAAIFFKLWAMLFRRHSHAHGCGHASCLLNLATNRACPYFFLFRVQV